MIVDWFLPDDFDEDRQEANIGYEAVLSYKAHIQFLADRIYKVYKTKELSK